MALATIQRLFCSKDEMSTKGFLGVKTDTSGDEERIELLDGKEKGTGIGLTICLKLLKQNNGDMIVKSKEGWGTAVTIILPCIQ